MKASKVIVGVSLLCLPLVGAGPDLTRSQFRKENLDLPFDAGASGDEEEEAPDSVFLYGQPYEGNAFVFCLDESMTMRDEKRFETQNREAKRAIDELISRTEFGVKFFGGSVHSFKSSLVPATFDNKLAAKRYINSREVEVGTCMGTAVVEAIEKLSRSSRSHRTVLVISDGQATDCPYTGWSDCGTQKRVNKQILDQVWRANAARKVTIHTIFVGKEDRCGISVAFLRRLAESNGGTYRSKPN